jgi:Ca2+-dependent lipid-binding protein
LPNKKSIGKQDPYCTLQLGTYVQKTKPDKRGGQHPQWDEQLHFEIYDDMEDQIRNSLETTESSGDSSTVEKPKKSRSKSSKSLRVMCYADDSKEPEFIGEGIVDLTDTLKSGEFDEWVTIKAKDRYAGEVYLELTFYSSVSAGQCSALLTLTETYLYSKGCTT